MEIDVAHMQTWQENVNRMDGSLAITMAILINMLTICQEDFIARVDQENDMLQYPNIATKHMAVNYRRCLTKDEH